MTTLVIGASGATGRLLVEQLLGRGEHVRAIVRERGAMPETLATNDRLTIIEASVWHISDQVMAEYVRGCDAIASCLGHNLSFKGMFLPPRQLVTDTTRRLCSAVQKNKPERTVKFVLMNTAGNSNRDLVEQLSTGHKCVISLLRLLLPPHADNEDAAEHLRTRIGRNDDTISWVVVRPDALIDESEPSDVTLHASPTRSAIFNAGETSRINVADFMATLIDDDAVWERWVGQMPVIYNS
ncbi:NAD(P)-binding oxidoreductase [Congregibacter brevis]|uniref:NAD(P)-binding oxidoreductase n=1 Tax=Congregibacter brevis TaxID=3081201 RepID=A0ABZ0IB10_9GAMM|nr:NAD(P)-binding oxidoreductase [Congregibacter sp. IMCC45268]